MTHRKFRPDRWDAANPARIKMEYGPPFWSWQVTVRSRALQRAHSNRLRVRRRNR